jgi:hypothetical protein
MLQAHRYTDPRFGLKRLPDASLVNMEAKKSMIKKALFAAGVGAVGAIVWHDLSFRDNVEIMGMMMPMPLVIGASTGLGSIVADTVHCYLMPQVKGSTETIIGIGIAGIGTIGFLKLAGADGTSFHWDAFALGGASFILSDYLNKTFTGLLAFP